MIHLTPVKILCAGFILFLPLYSLAAPLCRDLSATSDANGARILHERNPKLYTTPAVEKTARLHALSTGKTLPEPATKIERWLSQLSEIARRGQSSAWTLEKIKSVLTNQFVIDPKNVPSSYYKLQVRLARERGHGDIDLSPEQKASLAEIVVGDQTKSLEPWIDYLVSEDTKMYPMWIKYWMFIGMTKLSTFNGVTGLFESRSQGTVAPFPELNREAVALVVDYLIRFLNKESLKHLDDPDLETQLSTLNFGKIYGRVLSKLGVGQDGIFDTNEGKWILYPRGSDHVPLVNSLSGKNTGWCTAGASNARAQLDEGDFHVYFSLDKKGEPTVPRVAIRMEGSEIAEVRGVAHGQNLDRQISESQIVLTKIKEFGDRARRFERRDFDMKALTQIEKKHLENVALSNGELRFLYEVDRKIEGFGMERDPRIDSIIKSRDLKSDLIAAFDHIYTESEISILQSQALDGTTKVHYGNLNLKDLTSADGLSLPRIVIGSLNLSALKSPKGLRLPEVVNGSLLLGSLTSSTGLVLPTKVDGSINLSGLPSATGLIFPEILNGDLNLGSITSADGLVFPKTVNGDLFLAKAVSAKDASLPTTVNGRLQLHSLKSIANVKLPDFVNGELDLHGLKSAEGLSLPLQFSKGLNLSGLQSAEGLVLPETIRGALDLGGLKSAVDLKLPRSVFGHLVLAGLNSAAGLELPDTLKGNLYLNNLTSADGLKLPKSMNGGLHLEELTTAKGLELPDVLDGGLHLNKLRSPEGLKLPKTINGHLILKSLTSAEGLVLPETVLGYLDLPSLPSARGLLMPAGVISGDGYTGPEDITRR